MLFLQKDFGMYIFDDTELWEGSVRKGPLVLGVMLLALSFATSVFAFKVLQGKDFYDYVDVRKGVISAPPGKSVHWVFVWNHRRVSATVFDIPSTADCQGAAVHLEPQPNFYLGPAGWMLFSKRKGHIKVVVDNPGLVGQCVVEIPCRSYQGEYYDVLPLKIWLIKGNP